MQSSVSRKQVENQNGVFNGTALPKDTGDLGYEMDCFDRLGPQTKEAMYRASFKFCAFRFIRWCEQFSFDPHHPEVDAHLAALIYRDAKIGVDEVPQTIGLDQPAYL